MMHVVTRDDECQCIIMHGNYKTLKNGDLEFTANGWVEVRARRPYEAVRKDGAVFGAGDWFSFHPSKGDIVAIRPVEPTKVKFTKSEVDKARKSRTVTVVDQRRYDSGPFNFGASYEAGTLSAVIKSLVTIRAKIPEQYRASACCEIDSEGGYEGSHYAHIEVSYVRPETDAEVRERLRNESAKAVLQERNDQSELARLQARLTKPAAQGEVE